MTSQIKILPSLLAADCGRLEAEARKAECSGGDALHLDIMDGHFVRNLSMGPDVVRMARACVTIPLSVHLMIANPDLFVDRFVEAGADSILIHIETDCDASAVLRSIRAAGARAGITLNPETPADDVVSVLADVDEVLCMTVHPGYGGQKFIAAVLPKIRTLRDRLSAIGNDADIMVDGGMNAKNAAECARHGANLFVAGTTLYGAEDMTAEVRRVRRSAEAALA